jgi:long-chain fatty acid transport protein
MPHQQRPRPGPAGCGNPANGAAGEGKMGRFAVALFATGLVFASGPAHAQCGGICLYENGSSDLGRAAAGAGARAQDASTVLWNPAGMTELEGHELQIGLIGSFGDVDPSLKAGTTPPIVSGGNASGFGPLFGGSFSTELPYGIHFGIGSTALYGGAVDYNNSWTGRNYVTDASLISFLIQPSFAYAVTDWLSLGAGPAILYTTFTERVKAPLPGEPTVKINQADSWDAGGVFSALIKPVEGTRIGIYYRTEIEANTKGKLEGPLGANPQLNTDFHFPQGVNVSVYHQLNDAWALLGDAGWTQWSRFGNIPLQLDIPMGSVVGKQKRGWDDTWRIAAGTEYRFSDQWTFQGGFGYDSSPVRSKRLLPDIPASAQYRFSAGVQLRPQDYLELSLSYQFIWFEGLSFTMWRFRRRTPWC